jgi:glyoxylate reductase
VNPRLLKAPRVTLLPHIGSATIGTRTRMGRLACQGVADVLAGRTPPNLIVPTIRAV